jgi:hypothetical protein
MIAALLEGTLDKSEAERLMEHISGCDECSLEYALCASMLETGTEQPFSSGCPAPEKIALLAEGKLSGRELDEALLHISRCGECALTYRLTREMTETQRKPESKPIDTVSFSGYFRLLQKVAVFLLMIGIGYAGGFFSARGTQAPEDELALAVKQFETSSAYWDRLNDAAFPDNSRIGGTRGEELSDRGESSATPIQEALAVKNAFDRRLNDIRLRSGRDAETILGVPYVDIASLSAEEAETFAELLKNGKEAEMNLAGRWIVFDQPAYFSLVKRLPPEIWGKYPANGDSLRVLSRIADLPRAEKEKILSMSPEEAARAVREKY